MRDSREITVEEQVAIFLFMISHNESNRVMLDRFQHSDKTIIWYFNLTLDAILQLYVAYMVQPNGATVREKILSDSSFYPYFNSCIGALDRTHIPVLVSKSDAEQFHRRSNKMM